ncbi:MAG: translation initiation factor 2 [Gammaproteobacteria bacterium]|nr:translation initiation factor 2 [Gammaproteobacteria bacterium]
MLDQQFMRAVSSFEGIILSQISTKNRLGTRLNYTVQAGIIILGLIAVSILVLLLVLSSQINRISSVVSNMNTHFTEISAQMANMNRYVDTMGNQVALLESIDIQTDVMKESMNSIVSDMNSMQNAVYGISGHVSGVRNNVDNISMTMNLMDIEVVNMSRDIHRMGKPSRTLNKIFPFP